MDSNILLNLIKAAWQFRLRVIAALALLLAAKLAAVSVPLALKAIVDALSRPEEVHVLPVFLLAGYALLRFLGTLFNELRDVVFSRVTQRIVAGYAQQAFQKLHELSARFHSLRRTGALLRDIDRGTVGIAFLLGAGLFTIVPTLVEVGLVLAIMLSRYSGWFALIILATFVLYSMFTLYFTEKRAIVQRKVNELDSRAKARLADSLINYDAVRYFTNEHHESQQFRHIMAEWAHTTVRNQKALFILHVGQSALIALGVAGVMLLAGRGVVDGAMTVGDLVLINAYVIQICLPLNALGFVYREARDAETNAEELLRLLNENPEIRDPPGTPDLDLRHGSVVFSGVGFHYEPDRPILTDINLDIPPGRTVAVVGGSGSGKSTLARLLLRLYDVAEGRILIDGQDIRAFTQQSVRRAIGVVPQDTTLFNDTIAYNIRYGRLEASDEEVVQAAKAAHIHELIEALPEKYDTLVGERGVKLSGGERQRIAIARAILKNPPILIFDEATSALDSQSERAIQAELDRISRNRTTLIIAHRLSTIVAADEIVVLDRGRIVERGTHARLLMRNGMYAQMWLLQQREKRLERAGEKAAPMATAAVGSGRGEAGLAPAGLAKAKA